MIGVFLLLRLIPAFFMGNIAGVIADRFDRKKIIIFADIARAALTVCILILRDYLYPLYIIIFLISMCDRLYQSAQGGCLPNIAGRDNISRANAYLTSGRTIALIFGPTLGGILISGGSYSAAFLVDASTYLFSAIMVAAIGANFHSASTVRSRIRFIEGLKEGYRFIFFRPTLLSIIFLRCLDAFGSSSLNVGMPIFSSSLKQYSPGICYGLMMAAYGIGEMTGAIFLSGNRCVKRYPVEIIIGFSIFFMAAFFAIALSSEHIFWGMFFIYLCGIAEGVTLVSYNATLQDNPDDIRGRIVGFSETAVWSGMGIGMFISGIAEEMFSLAAVVQCFAAMIAVGSFVHIVYWLKKYKGGHLCTGVQR